MSEPIRISASGFAEYVTSRSRSRANKLRPFKFRNKGEGAGRPSYYQRALKAIRAYHKANQDEKVFDRDSEAERAHLNELSQLGRRSGVSTFSTPCNRCSSAGRSFTFRLRRQC